MHSPAFLVDDAGIAFSINYQANVRYWHKADNPTAPAFVRYWSNSGQRMTLDRDGLLRSKFSQCSSARHARVFYFQYPPGAELEEGLSAVVAFLVIIAGD